KSTSAIVVNTGGPSVITTNSTPVLCNGGNTGSATVTVTSGTTPYTYIWNPGATSTTSSTTDNATTLKADIYTVTIRDANGCDAITTVTVTEPPVLNAPTFSSSNAACGLSNGSAIANASGGTGALVYTWSNSTAGASATGLAAGTYTVTVTDANNCTASSSVTIGNSNGPKAAASVTSNVACNATNTGTATVTITSGSAPFTYSWSTGASSISSSLTDVQDSLSANTYTVTVTDTKGCSSTSTVAFTNPPAMTIKASGKDALCGFNDGTSTATASGGTPVYKFSWNNGDTTDTADNLAPGIYTVTATDSKGCTITITDTINSISSATINVIPAQQTIQQGASVSITVVGGVTYSWSPGEGLTCTTCPNPIATPTVSTIYTVTATDKNGCTATAKINITVRQPCTDEEDVFIANIFSPNGDSKNDMLYVQGNGLTNIYWAIYDRWGNLLFESFKQADGWDGTRKGAAMDSGTYVWYLKGTCLRTNSEVRLKGNTTIVK
ncbi:MAG: gliding motility-associated C-terminal domain-containing protein, partial [Bacteroidia bacterium]|nr:gliding motility-associated C-terminal domain-containing protein [Bacteroidia bacterium]